MAETLPGLDLRIWQLDPSPRFAALPSVPLTTAADEPTAADLAVASRALAEAPTSASEVHGHRSLRQLLSDFAVTLRDIRYRRGGREPSTGFDCSGFVHYVFRHSLGQDLPGDSASQYLAGDKVDRADMKTGDLVFFRTRGKRISHVGIYLDHGRFIHAPSVGKRVSISNLDESYWAKRFAGAKRPHALS